MTQKADSATRAWKHARAVIADVGVDLSDYSDEYVLGFAAGVDEARDRLEGRTVCTYCGHTAGCYCRCPIRLGHIVQGGRHDRA